MRTLSQIIALLWIIVGANLVAASTFGFMAQQMIDQMGYVESWPAWLAIAGTVLWATICFLMGAVDQARRWFTGRWR